MAIQAAAILVVILAVVILAAVILVTVTLAAVLAGTNRAMVLVVVVMGMAAMALVVMTSPATVLAVAQAQSPVMDKTIKIRTLVQMVRLIAMMMDFIRMIPPAFTKKKIALLSKCFPMQVPSFKSLALAEVFLISFLFLRAAPVRILVV